MPPAPRTATSGADCSGTCGASGLGGWCCRSRPRPWCGACRMSCRSRSSCLSTPPAPRTAMSPAASWVSASRWPRAAALAPWMPCRLLASPCPWAAAGAATCQEPRCSRTGRATTRRCRPQARGKAACLRGREVLPSRTSLRAWAWTRTLCPSCSTCPWRCRPPSSPPSTPAARRTAMSGGGSSPSLVGSGPSTRAWTGGRWTS
mmetsp:Transcript_49223/g.141260  ORF Transcript_49223/g.141260 Transcript_49223/m.141260 type:complete len:204 (+) Transcript_49223:566-1177(+)